MLHLKFYASGMARKRMCGVPVSSCTFSYVAFLHFGAVRAIKISSSLYSNLAISLFYISFTCLSVQKNFVITFILVFCNRIGARDI
jgi:hypothetical protein